MPAARSVATLETSKAASRRPGLLGRIAEWYALWVQRRQLASLCAADLSDERLRDMGLDRADAERESLRPFWDVPRHWRQ